MSTTLNSLPQTPLPELTQSTPLAVLTPTQPQPYLLLHNPVNAVVKITDYYQSFPTTNQLSDQQYQILSGDHFAIINYQKIVAPSSGVYELKFIISKLVHSAATYTFAWNYNGLLTREPIFPRVYSFDKPGVTSIEFTNYPVLQTGDVIDLQWKCNVSDVNSAVTQPDIIHHAYIWIKKISNVME